MELEISTIPNTASPATSDERLMLPSWAAALCPYREPPLPLDLRPEQLRATIQMCSGPGHNLVSATITGVRSLAEADFQATVTAAHLAVLRTLGRTRSPHPIRMWNFISDIHRPMGLGVDRYRVFNTGRFDAFSELSGSPGTGSAGRFSSGLPAASGVGQKADELTIHALGARSPGIAVENPWQVPAFAYSTAHGPRPPCFSRAVIAELVPPHHPHTGRRTLLISGTASIRGEDSTHPNDLSAQFDETIENIDRLARSIDPPFRFTLEGLETARIYHPRRADAHWLEHAALARLGPNVPIELVPAAICRGELLVEIEATIIAAAVPSTPSRGHTT